MFFEFLASFMALPFVLLCALVVASLATFVYLFSRSDSTTSFCLFVITIVLMIAFGYNGYENPAPFDPMSYIKPVAMYLGIGLAYALFDIIWATVTFRSKVAGRKVQVKAQLADWADRARATSTAAKDEFEAWAAFQEGTLDVSSLSQVSRAQDALHRYVSALNEIDRHFFLAFEARNILNIKVAANEDLMSLAVSRSRLTQRIIGSILYFPFKAVKLLLGDILDRIVRGVITVFQKQLQKVVNVLFKDLLKF